MKIWQNVGWCAAIHAKVLLGYVLSIKDWITLYKWFWSAPVTALVQIWKSGLECSLTLFKYDTYTCSYLTCPPDIPIPTWSAHLTFNRESFAILVMFSPFVFFSQRFVLSAAHCFCVEKNGANCIWNDEVSALVMVMRVMLALMVFWVIPRWGI